jgi:hypothetical protein
MLDLASIATDLTEIIADLPVTCVFNGTSFTATSSDDSQNRAIEIDGTFVDVDRLIVVLAANVPAGLVYDKKLTVGGKSYRVLNLSQHQDSHGVEIRLKADVR